jgi:hypothetical protein
MSNFKYPQYLTQKGLVRSAKIPKLKPLHHAPEAGNKITSQQTPSRLRLLVEKRVLANRALQRQKEGISEEAAKAIAEAIKTLLHS